ncbi:MAG: response regulator transcription factor [Ruminococcus sp.]|nr:response regulator transcription factor [Ruminococcus sp.]
MEKQSEQLKRGPGRPRRDPISDEQKVEVKRLRVEQAKSYYEIAAALDLDPQTVGKYCRREELVPDKVRAYKLRDQEIVELFTQGFSTIYIAAQMHLAQKTVRMILNENGIVTRKVKPIEHKTLAETENARDLSAKRIGMVDVRNFIAEHPVGTVYKFDGERYVIEAYYSQIALLRHAILGYHRGPRLIDLAYYNKFGVFPGDDWKLYPSYRKEKKKGKRNGSGKAE